MRDVAKHITEREDARTSASNEERIPGLPDDELVRRGVSATAIRSIHIGAVFVTDSKHSGSDTSISKRKKTQPIQTGRQRRDTQLRDLCGHLVRRCR